MVNQNEHEKSADASGSRQQPVVKTHQYDDDGCCINCGFYGAEHSWDMRNLRLEIGDDEWLYRKKCGDFDWAEHCGLR